MRNLNFLCLLGCMMMSAGSVTAEDIWSVRSHPFPGSWLEEGVVVEGKGRLFLPATPAADADEDVVRDFILRSTAVIRAALPELEEGTLIIFDRPGGTLAARATVKGHALLEGLQRELEELMPKVMRSQVVVMETTTARALKLLEETQSIPDHSSQMEAMENLANVEGSEVTMLASGSIETKSGQRSMLEMSLYTIQPTEMLLRKGGANIGTEMETTNMGLEFELDPVISGDGRVLDLDFSLVSPLALPSHRLASVGTFDGKPIKVSVMDDSKAKLKSAITLLNGQTRLIAIWPALDMGKVQTLFLTANAPVVRPKPSLLAQTWLVKEGEAVLPAPDVVPPPPEDLTLPPGMLARTFRLPAGFFSTDTKHQYADAFAPATAREPGFMVRMTAEDILKSKGVVFPEGASATLDSATNKLLVRNTQDNLDLIERLIQDFLSASPYIISHRLWVVEGPTDRFRSLIRAAQSVTDHGDVWREVETDMKAGTARVVELALMESKGGRRFSLLAASSFTYAQADTNVLSTPTVKEGTTVNIRHADEPNLITTTLENIMPAVGLEWDLDAFLGSNKVTIDLDTGIQINRNPVLSRLSPLTDVASDETLRFDTNEILQPLQRLRTEITTTSGMRRLIGSWHLIKTDGSLNRDRLQLIFISSEVLDLE